jgi:predicted HicB family RNase H-like nuclease
MVGMFKSLLSLPEDIKLYVRSGKISIDKAVRIASLQDAVSQEFLAEAITAEPDTFTKHIVANIVSLRNQHQDMPIEDCTRMVLKSKPIVETRYILVTGIEKELSKILNGKAKKRGVSLSDLLKDILEQSLPNRESLLSIATHDGVILLTLTADGWQALRQKSGSLGVPLDELVETLAKLWLKAGAS